jgi:hypothetical protein
MFPWWLKRFQGLGILRKFVIPNFYLDGLRNIKRLGAEKFGKRGILILSDGRRSFTTFRNGKWLSPRQVYCSKACGGKTEMSRKYFYKIERNACAL